VLDAENVIVTVPTISGKTVIGELAALKNAESRQRASFSAGADRGRLHGLCDQTRCKWPAVGSGMALRGRRATRAMRTCWPRSCALTGCISVRFSGDSEQVEVVKTVARTHQMMIWTRQRQTNQLRSMLREFYPAALAAFGDELSGRDAQAFAALTASPVAYSPLKQTVRTLQKRPTRNSALIGGEVPEQFAVALFRGSVLRQRAHGVRKDVMLCAPSLH
jgi:hypothetical protein